jgi:hypothetical protein
MAKNERELDNEEHPHDLVAQAWFDPEEKKLRQRYCLGFVNSGHLVISKSRKYRVLNLYWVDPAEDASYSVQLNLLMQMMRSLSAIRAKREVSPFPYEPYQGEYNREGQLFLCNLADGEYVVETEKPNREILYQIVDTEPSPVPRQGSEQVREQGAGAAPVKKPVARVKLKARHERGWVSNVR